MLRVTEYMQVQYKYIYPDIKEVYILKDKVTAHGYIYMRIKKGMYGLKQAAILAYNNLKGNLKPFGYAPVIGTVGIWKDETRTTTFCLCVDRSTYCGLTLEWNYEYGYVNISMPGYVERTLARLQYTPKRSPQYSPHTHMFLLFIQQQKTQQYATAPDTSPLINPKETCVCVGEY